MFTSLKGMSPVNSSPSITMRATHRKMMSRAGGEDVRRIEGAQRGRLLGPAERGEGPQPGREPGVEHVGVALPALALRAAPRPRRSRRPGTRPAAGDPTRAGARCTRGGCSPASRDTRPSRASRDGRRCGRRGPPRSPAWRARPCRRTTGARSAAPPGDPSAGSAARRARRAACPETRPSARRAATTAARASSASIPRKASGAASVMRPSSPITVTSSRRWARPMSKSAGSCPGVIFSAPVPNSGSTYSSAMISRRRPTSGRIADSPISRE